MNIKQSPESLAVFEPAVVDHVHPGAAQRWASGFALAAIGFQAAAGMTAFSAIKPEFGAMLAGLLLPFAGRGVWRSLAASGFVRVLAVFSVFVVAQTLYLGGMAGQTITLQHLAEEASKPAKLELCAVAIGAWLSLYPRMIAVVMKLMVLGLLLQVVLSLCAAPWPAMLAGDVRLGFGYAENLSGAFAALGLLAFTLMALDLGLHGRSRWQRLAMCGCIGAALVMLLGLMLAGSRGAWLAAAVCLPLAIGAYVRYQGWGRWKRRLPAGRVFCMLAMAFVGATAVMVLRAAANNRLNGAATIGARVLEGRFSAIPMSSVGIRLHLLRHGLEWFADHPMIGYGLGAISHRISLSTIKVGDYVPTHLHDLYLQSLVGMGIVGTSLLLAGGVLLARGVRRAYRQGRTDPLAYWLLVGAVGLLAIVNLFDCLAWHMMFARIPIELLLGCALAMALQTEPFARLRQPDTATPGDPWKAT